MSITNRAIPSLALFILFFLGWLAITRHTSSTATSTTCHSRKDCALEHEAASFQRLSENSSSSSIMIRKILDVSRDILKYGVFDENGSPLTQKQVFELLTDSAAEGETFRRRFAEVLRNVDMPSYFWETPPTSETVATVRPFEFVVVRAMVLDSVEPEAEVFAEHFHYSCSTAVFRNLGGDSILISPSPCDNRDYAHIARFVRNASLQEQSDLFKKVGEVALQNLSQRPMWLSTSGAGVYWLHIRFDSFPKYYTYEPYRNQQT